MEWVCRTLPQHVLTVQQGVRQYGLSKAAGRTEKKDSTMHHEAVKPFLNGGLYDNIFGHFFPPSYNIF